MNLEDKKIKKLVIRNENEQSGIVVSLWKNSNGKLLYRVMNGIPETDGLYQNNNLAIWLRFSLENGYLKIFAT